MSQSLALRWEVSGSQALESKAAEAKAEGNALIASFQKDLVLGGPGLLTRGNANAQRFSHVTLYVSLMHFSWPQVDIKKRIETPFGTI